MFSLVCRALNKVEVFRKKDYNSGHQKLRVKKNRRYGQRIQDGHILDF